MIEIYVITTHPDDHPRKKFVMRFHRLSGYGPTRTVKTMNKVWSGKRIEDVTQHIPAGKQRHAPCAADPSHLVEWWH